MSTLSDTKQVNVDQSSCVDEVPPAFDGPTRRLHPRCDSLQRPRSLWLGALVIGVVMTALPQGEMKRTTLDVGMRCSGEEESSAVHDGSVYIRHVTF